MLPGFGVPWMPTPGADRPIQRVPSGLPGPGGTGLCAGGPRRVRRVPPRVHPLDDDVEAAARRRVGVLAGGDAERPPRLHAVVERERVRAAVDHDHGRLGLGQRQRLELLRRHAHRQPRVRVERVDDAPDELALVELPPVARAAPMYGLPWRRPSPSLAGARSIRAASFFAHARTAAPWTSTTSGRFVPGFAARACPTAPLTYGFASFAGSTRRRSLSICDRRAAC